MLFEKCFMKKKYAASCIYASKSGQYLPFSKNVKDFFNQKNASKTKNKSFLKLFIIF